MAVAKKDQERVTYAWMYGAQARKDGKERVVPEYWHEQAEAWLQGFDGSSVANAPKTKPVSDQLEAELGEAGISQAPGADPTRLI